MQVIHKDAAISAPTDDDFPGSFEAILSAPTKDRDGDTLLADEWKMPLPDHITVDMDHKMSVEGTIGSARPWIDEKGNLRISGTFASTPEAQKVRTLVKEGHVNRTSVAFMTEKTQKDGVTSVQRELLNAAIVAIPSNREAAILAYKGIKAGARNSSADQVHLDAIARHAIALGANIGTVDDATSGDDSADPDVAAAKGPAWAGESRGFTLNRPGRKDADTEDASDPVALITATDAAIDAAIDLFAQVDATTLPAEIQQAIALVQAADTAVDELLDALGIPDPDEDADTAADPDVAAAAKAAAATDGHAAVEDALDQQLKAARQRFYATLSEGN